MNENFEMRIEYVRHGHYALYRGEECLEEYDSFDEAADALEEWCRT